MAVPDGHREGIPMTRLFDRHLAQPEPLSLYDFLSTAQHLDDRDAVTAQRTRTMLADPQMARVARAVRPSGMGMRVDEVEDIPVVAAEAVHERIMGAGLDELYGRLRPCPGRPPHEAMYVEVQKLRGELGPVEAYGWLLITRAVGDGEEVEGDPDGRGGPGQGALSPGEVRDRPGPRRTVPAGA
jgi:hypothetical protein